MIYCAISNEGKILERFYSKKKVDEYIKHNPNTYVYICNEAFIGNKKVIYLPIEIYYNPKSNKNDERI